jgi:hypothetical protein
MGRPGGLRVGIRLRKKELRAAFRNGIEVVHGLPVMLDSIGDQNSTLAILDFFEWLGLCSDSRDITEIRAACIREIRKLLSDESVTASMGTPLAPTVAGSSPLASPKNTQKKWSRI